MKESATYQAILEEGEVKAARRILLALGSKRYGPPDAKNRAAIDSINSVAKLEQLATRVDDIASWDQLLSS